MQQRARPRVICHMAASIDGRIVVDGWPDAVATAVRRQYEQVHASYAAAVDTFCATVEGLDAEGWRALAEAPPGHVGVDAVVHHALWDSWVHERDVLVPLGLDPHVEEDEVLAVLAYAAGLGPSFDLQPDRQGTLVVEVVDAGAEIVVEVGASVHVSRGPLGRTTSATARLSGDAVDIVVRATTSDEAYVVAARLLDDPRGNPMVFEVPKDLYHGPVSERLRPEQLEHVARLASGCVAANSPELESVERSNRRTRPRRKSNAAPSHRGRT